MIPKCAILVRHGESDTNVDLSVYCCMTDWRIALTKIGIAKAKVDKEDNVMPSLTTGGGITNCLNHLKK